MNLPKELKTAISKLSDKEKDRLIFKLLKKDLILANRLLFEFVSSKSVEQQREEIKNLLTADIEQATQNYYSPGNLLMYLRDMSGMINEHLSMTRDKYGEISLNIYVITEILEHNKENILRATEKKAEKFCTEIIAKTFKTLLLIQKMPEDCRADFNNDLQKLAGLISNTSYLIKEAIFNGLDVNWLLQGNIPDDIEKIYKELKKRGCLK